MVKQTDLDAMYMDFARRASQMSQALRLKVGAILVDAEGGCMGEGWNGTFAGCSTNTCEYVNADAELVTRADVIHAESNAIGKITCTTRSTKGATLYITHAPCQQCALEIIKSKIARVCFAEHYRDTNGIGLLRAAGVQVDQV